ncbi:prepilin-type N-terminal cleavage/methylation domain-containing protein [Candidatus Falkowbacteria bacterium]|nr:prepilin-type N-terminal cleavage/methylation domain-containing protein [Candidatus Falkowbacteria bacterium]
MKKGFSLIELIVVMALFLTLMLVVSDIFLSVSMVQRKTLAYQQAANDLQFNLEQIVQQIRLNKIDYDYYGGGLSNAVQELALRGADGAQILFKKVDAHCPVGVSSCVAQTADSQSSIMTADNVNIEKLEFNIMPAKNPYDFDKTMNKFSSDEQPIVTVVLIGKTLAPIKDDQKEIFLQTAVSSRFYVR